MVLHVVLLNLHQARHLNVALGISLAGIPGNDVTQFGTVKQFLLVFHLDILRHQHCVSNLNGTIHLAQVTLQHIALLSVIGLHLLILAGTVLIHLHLLVDKLVIHLDVIVVHLVLTAQLSLELRGYGDIELEGQRVCILQILGLLSGIGQRLTQHLYLILADVLIQLLAQHLVHHVHLDSSTILALNHAHRGLTGTESRNVSTLTIVFQSLVYLSLVVVFLQRDGHQTIHLVRSFKCNIHLAFIPYLYYYMRFYLTYGCSVQLCNERAKVRINE